MKVHFSSEYLLCQPIFNKFTWIHLNVYSFSDRIKNEKKQDYAVEVITREIDCI